ncbi:MAG TPA: DUF5335 family protein [Thermoanaerobaculia bacterium]
MTSNVTETEMVTREIPREEWPEFFEEFTRRHEGWLVTVENFGDLGAQVEEHERPLKGIFAEGKKETPAVEILTGATLDETFTHAVAHPTRVRVEETPEGAESALEIQSRDEGTTLVRFRAAALPETVDGVGPGLEKK